MEAGLHGPSGQNAHVAVGAELSTGRGSVHDLCK